jgi:hypothetical protein
MWLSGVKYGLFTTRKWFELGLGLHPLHHEILATRSLRPQMLFRRSYEGLNKLFKKWAGLNFSTQVFFESDDLWTFCVRAVLFFLFFSFIYIIRSGISQFSLFEKLLLGFFSQKWVAKVSRVEFPMETQWKHAEISRNFLREKSIF